VANTFAGGLYIKTERKTASMASKPFAEPSRVSIPLNGGTPTVAVGDHVDIGTCVGNGPCPAHASVSGTVTAIMAHGDDSLFVVIDNDCKHTVTAALNPVTKPLDALTAEDITVRIQNAGIVDTNSGVPLWQTLKAAAGKTKRVVISCAESEPWLTANSRLPAEQAESLIKGIKILIYTLGARKADIVVDENSKSLVPKVLEHIADKALIDVKVVTAKHPIGHPRQLVYALYNKRAPMGKTVLDIGYAVLAPETALAVYRALSTGMPVIHKRITVEGDAIKRPCNLTVPIGTSAKDIAELCGGTKKRFKRLVLGSAMEGVAATSLTACVDKTTDAVLFLSDLPQKETGCIRCGRCIPVCPVGLTPALLAAYGEKGLYAECEALGVHHCIGCGCCAYTCPGGVPIVKYIGKAKEALAIKTKQEENAE